MWRADGRRRTRRRGQDAVAVIIGGDEALGGFAHQGRGKVVKIMPMRADRAGDAALLGDDFDHELLGGTARYRIDHRRRRIGVANILKRNVRHIGVDFGRGNMVRDQRDFGQGQSGHKLRPERRGETPVALVRGQELRHFLSAAHHLTRHIDGGGAARAVGRMPAIQPDIGRNRIDRIPIACRGGREQIGKAAKKAGPRHDDHTGLACERIE